MKTKIASLFALVVLAFALLALKEPPAPLVEVGKSYFISTGESSTHGEILEDLGGGWYRISQGNRDNGKDIKVNLNRAFFFYEQKS